MCILVISCFYLRGEGAGFWDAFFLFYGPIISGYLAGITSKNIHIALLSCLAMSVIVGLMISWMEGIGVLIYLLTFSVIGLIPARMVFLRNRLRRTVKYWGPALLLTIVVFCIISAFLVLRPPKITISIQPDPPIQVKPGHYIDFDLILENHGGKAKGVTINVTFPEGFITHKHKDMTRRTLVFYDRNLYGGQSSRIGKDVIASKEPGTYTGQVIITGDNFYLQTKNFTIIVNNG
jgi:hypothetical protein